MSQEHEATNRALIEELSAQLNQARAETINNGVALRLANARIAVFEAEQTQHLETKETETEEL